jgi:hypothetical protein
VIQLVAHPPPRGIYLKLGRDGIPKVRY